MKDNEPALFYKVNRGLNLLEAREEDNILWLTISRPERRNSLNRELAFALTERLSAIKADSPMRAVVLSGAGDKAFCAGGDLKPAASGSPFEIEPHQPTHFYADLLRAMDACPVPVIGRINGSAFGGGVGILAACDYAVGVATAKFGIPEAKVGMFPFMVMPFLLRVISQREFLALAITGDTIDAARAKELGLLQEVAAPGELDQAVAAVLSRVTACSPTALRLGKHGLRIAREARTSDALALMQALLPLSTLTSDAKEGLRAFSEKRLPQWSGS